MVRQTVSKWEQGLSVPDAGLLIALAEALDTSVSTLLSENAEAQQADELKVISEKLEVINHQLAERKEDRRKALRLALILTAGIIILIFILLYFMESPYLGWDYSDPETAVIGVGLHSLEWIFVRTAPLALIGCIFGIVLTGRRER